MFCRYCGKRILENSKYCTYCGKMLSDSIDTESANESQDSYNKFNVVEQNHSDTTHASKTTSEMLQRITQITCYMAFGLFLILNIKMAPMEGLAQIGWYILSATIAIGIIVLFNKKVLPSESKLLYILFLFVATFVIIASISLRIIYESKVDSVTENIPSTGSIDVIIKEETKFYNFSGMGQITNPKTSIKIGDKWYESGNRIQLELNKAYPFAVRVTGGGIPSVETEGEKGESTLVIRKSSLSNGQYSKKITVYFDLGTANSADVIVTLSRYCKFWDVILF